MRRFITLIVAITLVGCAPAAEEQDKCCAPTEEDLCCSPDTEEDQNNPEDVLSFAVGAGQGYRPAVSAQEDLTADGYEEIVIGHAGSVDDRRQIFVLSAREDHLVDITDRFEGLDTLRLAAPLAVAGRFGGTGLDLAIFEREGRSGLELEDHVGAQGGFVSEFAPVLFLSNEAGEFRQSSRLADAVYERRVRWGDQRCGTPYEAVWVWDPNAGDPPGVGNWVEAPGCDLYKVGDDLVPTLHGSELHVKAVSAAGDITGDGLDEIVAETGGGWATIGLPSKKLFVFSGDDVAEDAVADHILDGPSDAGWRHYQNLVVDINDDGAADIIMGRLGNFDDRPESAFFRSNRNKVLINSGDGTFEHAIELPDPHDFFSADEQDFVYVTRVDAIIAADLNASGRIDLILVHTRGGTAVPDPPVQIQSGRWIQILLQTAAGDFEDVTGRWYPEQVYEDFSHGPGRVELFLAPDGTRELLIFGSHEQDTHRYRVEDRLIPMEHPALPVSMARLADGRWVEIHP